jgi:hypothetical protein
VQDEAKAFSEGLERLEQREAAQLGGIYFLIGIPDDEPLPASAVSPCGGLHVLYMRQDELEGFCARTSA